MYCDCVIKIYVGINAMAQEVFSICNRPLGVLFNIFRISVGISVAIVQWGLCIRLWILLLGRGLHIVHETGRRR